MKKCEFDKRGSMFALVLVVALAFSGARGLSWEVDAGDAVFFSRVACDAAPG
jgi:hypothetical protein